MAVPTLLLLHAAATLFMTGLIWFVQVVHYPLFARVGMSDFGAYSIEHQRRTTVVVAPVMLLELTTAIALVLQTGEGPRAAAAWVGLGLLGVIWLSTMLVQTPLHRRLLAGLDPHLIDQLVHGNWFRTLAWSLRAVLALWWLGTQNAS